MSVECTLTTISYAKKGVIMGKFNLTEYIQEHLPKRISKEFELTGKKIRAKNLKANQF